MARPGLEPGTPRFSDMSAARREPPWATPSTGPDRGWGERLRVPGRSRAGDPAERRNRRHALPSAATRCHEAVRPLVPRCLPLADSKAAFQCPAPFRRSKPMLPGRLCFQARLSHKPLHAAVHQFGAGRHQAAAARRGDGVGQWLVLALTVVDFSHGSATLPISTVCATASGECGSEPPRCALRSPRVPDPGSDR
jgi:hypothetical protein